MMHIAYLLNDDDTRLSLCTYYGFYVVSTLISLRV
jgi:hypothetical protein